MRPTFYVSLKRAAAEGAQHVVIRTHHALFTRNTHIVVLLDLFRNLLPQKVQSRADGSTKNNCLALSIRKSSKYGHRNEHYASLRVHLVHLVIDGPRHARILDLRQPVAVHVPDSRLGYISQAGLGALLVSVGQEDGHGRRHAKDVTAESAVVGY